MNQQMKGTYAAPQLKDYGSVHGITRNGGNPNSDVPKGPPNSGFSPAP